VGDSQFNKSGGDKMKNRVSLSLAAFAALVWLSVAAFYIPVTSSAPHGSSGKHSTCFASDPTLPPQPPPIPRSGQSQQA